MEPLKLSLKYLQLIQGKLIKCETVECDVEQRNM